MNLPNMKEARLRTEKEVNTFYNEYDNLSKIGKNKTYAVLTYGCQMNVHDSEEIKYYMNEMGFTYVVDYEQSDVVLFNTCAIRENAHNKVFGLLGRIKHLKETKKDIIVGILGCMSQEEEVVLKIKKEYKWINFVIGTHNINDLPKVMENVLKDKTQQIEVYSTQGDIFENTKYDRDSKYKAWINIMYGCDKFCTYCIVPYTRGKQRSRKIKDIVKEVEVLVEAGYQEVTLLGQNVNAYGKDLNDDSNLSLLLTLVSQTGIKRIRFTTSHPWDFTDEMIDVISSHENIMPHIHLPVQSGSDDILKKMGRKYSVSEYLTLVSKLKEKIKNISLTTDIIVGFPNETEEDFNKTLELVNICKFDSAFTFIYSPREKTPASMMKDNVRESVKNKRLQQLNTLVNNYSLENNKKMINKEVEVLLESVSPKNKEILSGYTDNMKLVNVFASSSLIGTIQKVVITEAKSFSLNGKLL